ncbi:MAG: type II 3-dehydroquinate dehydratase [Desulfovibrionaceae bacterium]|jgi:3-dehydroquinate dehydratase-2
MDIYEILVLNGPNLKHIGVRQPEIYGSESLDGLGGLVERLMGPASREVRLETAHSNSEGGLIDILEDARERKISGVVLNAGAYTHTSLALADCLAWIGLPCVEVHLSNVMARTDQPLRQTSHIGRHVVGVIAGFGVLSYALAVQALYQHIKHG